MTKNRDKRKVFLKIFRVKEKVNLPNKFFRRILKKKLCIPPQHTKTQKSRNVKNYFNDKDL